MSNAATFEEADVCREVSGDDVNGDDAELFVFDSNGCCSEDGADDAVVQAAVTVEDVDGVSIEVLCAKARESTEVECFSEPVST